MLTVIDDAIGFVGEYGEEPNPDGDDFAWILESRWTFQREEQNGDENILSYETTFEFYINRQLLVKNSPRNLDLNLAHPLLIGAAFKVDFVELARICPDLVSLTNGYLTIRGFFIGFHPRAIYPMNMSFMTVETYKSPNKEHMLLLAALEEVKLVIHTLLNTATGNSRFKPSVVKASRTVPTRSELVFQFGNLDDQIVPLLPKLNKS